MTAFDNVIQKARQAATTASRKTGIAVEISKLRMQVRQVNAMMQSTYERVGTLVYEQEKTQTDNSDLVAVCIKEIDSLLVELNVINDRINTLKNGVKCPNCATINLSDTTYCKACGANMRRQRPCASTAEASAESSTKE